MKDRTAWKFSLLVPEKLSSVTLIFSEHCSFPRSWAVLWTLGVLTCSAQISFRWWGEQGRECHALGNEEKEV